MEEIKCEQIGMLSGGKWDKLHDQSRRVYGVNGLAPTMHTCGGGNLEPKIAEPIIYDDYNSRIRADQDCIGTLTTNCGESALRSGVKIIEPVIVDEIYNNREPRVYGDYCPTIRAERQGLEVLEPTEQYIGCAVHPISKKLEFDGYKDTVCPTLLATDYKCPKTVALR